MNGEQHGEPLADPTMEEDAFTRRDFLLGTASAAAAAGLAACGKEDAVGTTATQPKPVATVGPGIDPSKAPFDTVVVLMMENRGFDHLLGWLPGANGQQTGLSFKDKTGAEHPTWPLAPDWQGCTMQDPFHLWEAVATQWNKGAMDGFLLTQPANDLFPIGYYTDKDLPILAALAQNYTCFDNYFCSMLGPTWPNRFYQWAATTDLNYTGFFPTAEQPRPSNIETTIFDRLRAAGKTGAYYSFGEPMTGLFASKKYDDMSFPFSQFETDAKQGKLANVVFVDPDYTSASEFNGTSNDMHAYGSVQVGDAFIGQVHDILAASPQWGRMVFVLNYDEHGGFFDTVTPPRCQDDTVIPGGGPQPDLTSLGVRVPCIAMGPFAPQKIDASGPYEHCSVLKMIEWRWGLEPMTKRDATANNLANALDFTLKRAPMKLPTYAVDPATVCVNPNHLP